MRSRKIIAHLHQYMWTVTPQSITDTCTGLHTGVENHISTKLVFHTNVFNFCFWLVVNSGSSKLFRESRSSCMERVFAHDECTCAYTHMHAHNALSCSCTLHSHTFEAKLLSEVRFSFWMLVMSQGSAIAGKSSFLLLLYCLVLSITVYGKNKRGMQEQYQCTIPKRLCII